jgi:hypothetical protein
MNRQLNAQHVLLLTRFRNEAISDFSRTSGGTPMSCAAFNAAQLEGAAIAARAG